MESEYVIISGAITIVALILLSISIVSYKRYRNKKLLFVITVFLFFLIRGVLLSIGSLYDPLGPIASSHYMWIFDLIILTMLYLAAFQR
jgi:hypothetical protein